jgi:hypothetical protein
MPPETFDAPRQTVLAPDSKQPEGAARRPSTRLISLTTPKVRGPVAYRGLDDLTSRGPIEEDGTDNER